MAKQSKQISEVEAFNNSASFIPDIPAQQIVEEIIPMEELKEVKILKKILHIQQHGGWGKHLDDIINERLKEIEHEYRNRNLHTS